LDQDFGLGQLKRLLCWHGLPPFPICFATFQQSVHSGPAVSLVPDAGHGVQAAGDLQLVERIARDAEFLAQFICSVGYLCLASIVGFLSKAITSGGTLF